jgi:WD40-like Beta Propeller Repeat
MALSHLRGRGVRLETHEAVALARELLAQPCGIPTPDNIQLGSDGSASCIAADGMPSVASVADLLQTLLPAGTPNVPAPLRYAIARGLGAVEAPSFGSLIEFSNALARFEKGSSRDVLRGLLQRGARPSRPIAGPGAAAPPAPPAASPVTARPSVLPFRAPLVVHEPPLASPRPSQRIVAAPSPMFGAFSSDKEAGSPAHSSRRWALAAAAALVASFAAGFGVMGGITDRRAEPKPAGSPRVPRAIPAATPPANASAAKPAEEKPTAETSDAPRTPSVARESAPPTTPAAARVPADPRSEPVADVDGHVKAIEGVSAVDANAFSPAFASDGTAIFFHTGRESDARSAIEVATAGRQPGGELGIITIVDDGSHNYHAQPSPDGRFVAFDSDRDGERGVYVANSDGSQVRRVSGGGYAAVPTWSRNGEWLAYIRAEADKPSVWNLWVQPAAGGSARRVTNYRYGQTWAASWFPDDRRIAYSHEDTLIVMDVPTGEATRYRTPIQGQLVRTPAVSPDGTKIIFQVFRHGAWLLDLADGSMQQVLTDPTAEEFAWSPDGRRVAFHSRRDGRWGIYVLSTG